MVRYEHCTASNALNLALADALWIIVGGKNFPPFLVCRKKLKIKRAENRFNKWEERFL